MEREKQISSENKQRMENKEIQERGVTGRKQNGEKEKTEQEDENI